MLVGYVPSSDVFLLGFDLWIRQHDGDGDDAYTMAGGLCVVRLTLDGETLSATVVSKERLPSAIYEGGTRDVIGARHPGFIEVDVD